MEIDNRELEEKINKAIKAKNGIVKWLKTGLALMDERSMFDILGQLLELCENDVLEDAKQQLHLQRNFLQKKFKENEDLRKQNDKLQLEIEKYKYDKKKAEEKLKRLESESKTNKNATLPKLNGKQIDSSHITERSINVFESLGTEPTFFRKQPLLKKVSEKSSNTDGQTDFGLNNARTAVSNTRKSPKHTNNSNNVGDVQNKKQKLSKPDDTSTDWIKKPASVKKPSSVFKESGFLIEPKTPTPKTDRRHSLSLTKSNLKQTQLKFAPELPDTDETFCEDLEDFANVSSFKSILTDIKKEKQGKRSESLGELSFSVSKLGMQDNGLNDSDTMNNAIIGPDCKVKKEHIYDSQDSDLLMLPTQTDSVIVIQDSYDFQTPLDAKYNNEHFFSEDSKENEPTEEARKQGNFCKECEKYYNVMDGMDGGGQRMLPCRHEEGRIMGYETPLNFWNPCFSPTQKK